MQEGQQGAVEGEHGEPALKRHRPSPQQLWQQHGGKAKQKMPAKVRPTRFS